MGWLSIDRRGRALGGPSAYAAFAADLPGGQQAEPGACPCAPTEQPDEGCLAIQFSDVTEPDDEDVECE